MHKYNLMDYFKRVMETKRLNKRQKQERRPMYKKLNMVMSAQLLAIAGLLTIASPAISQDFSNFLRNAFDNKHDNKHKQKNLNAAMIQTITSYRSKRIDLENEISMALAKNQITQQQANDWQTQISANADLQNSATDDGYFTFLEAQNVLDKLNSIDNEIKAAVNLSKTNQNTRGSKWSQHYRRDHWNDEKNINLTQKEILNRLQNARMERRITQKDYHSLKSQYNEIVGNKSGAEKFRGRRSSQERSDILNRLHNLNNSITQHLHNRRISGR